MLNNTFRSWRYGNPVGQRQMEGLSLTQLLQWQECSSSWVKRDVGTIRHWLLKDRK